MYTAQTLKQRIDDLKQRVFADKTTHADWREFLADRNPDLWAIVSKALITRAKFYKAEITRAKHDMLRYTMGQEPVFDNFPQMVSDWMNSDLNGLMLALGELDEASARMDAAAQKSEFEQWKAGGLYQLADMLVRLQIQGLNDCIESLERHTYGG